MEEQARQDAAARHADVGLRCLGVGLRLVRYGCNFPLWGDESFVAVNFIARGYRALLDPLDYGQICALLVPLDRALGRCPSRLQRVDAPALPAGLRRGQRLVVPPCGRSAWSEGCRYCWPWRSSR